MKNTQANPIIENETTVKNEWIKIPEAYDRVVVNTPEYKKSIEAILSVISKYKAKSLLDLGCGTGRLMLEAHRRGVFSSTGIDSSDGMIHIAKENLKEFNSELLLGDVTKPAVTEQYEVTVSRNVLFNLDNPMEHLKQAYERTTPGGIFIISSLRERPNLAAVREDVIAYYKNSGQYDSYKEDIDLVFGLNEDFLSRAKIYASERMEKLLTEYIGFDDILLSTTDYYHNFLIVARKPKVKKQPKLLVTRDEKLRNKGFRLRYFMAKDDFEAISENRSEVYIRDNEEHGLSAVAMVDNKVVGFVNAVSGRYGFKVADEHSVRLVYRTHQPENVYYIGGLVINKAYRGNKLGARLIATIMKEIMREGGTAVIGEGIPGGLRSIQNCGGKVIGKKMDIGDAKVQTAFYYNDLRNQLNRNKISSLTGSYRKAA